MVYPSSSQCEEKSMKVVTEPGGKFQSWIANSLKAPSDIDGLRQILLSNREFSPVDSLDYGDYGLEDSCDAILTAIKNSSHIALYADYDVDGTMSCVSWVWFLQAIGHQNFSYYIPDRFKEGYGLNLQAVKHLIDERGAELIITMDTGITANEEAAYCKERGVQFICTDHHKIQPDKMPDCIILNPKTNPKKDYQELCGCGITFVLLRRLGKHFSLNAQVWNDILALTGMATICDIVPLNGVNHKLAAMGVKALMTSGRPVLISLREAASMHIADEKDVGFRVGPRINAVGRLEHAHKVIEAFVSGDPEELVEQMGLCNERRKKIQAKIVEQAREQVIREQITDCPIIFLGGDWHPGVVGIAASKLVEENWKSVGLFEMKGDECKGSARSIDGFDVTEAMSSVKGLFTKFGGHKAAGGFSFPKEHFDEIKLGLIAYAEKRKMESPHVWQSKLHYDCEIPQGLLNLSLLDSLDDLKPFGHKFEEPVFKLVAEVLSFRFYKDKVTGEPKHTAIEVRVDGRTEKVMFFGEVIEELCVGVHYQFVVNVSRNVWRGRISLNLMGRDLKNI